MTADDSHLTCSTCYGQGVTTTEQGPGTCPDCAGTGRLPSPHVLTERRLRELERIYRQVGGEAGQDVQWLVTEVRRAHHALLQILAASHDTNGAANHDASQEGHSLPDLDPILSKIKFLANGVLGVYPVKPA